MSGVIQVKIGSKQGLTLYDAKFTSYTDAGKYVDGILASDENAHHVILIQEPVVPLHRFAREHVGFLG